MYDFWFLWALSCQEDQSSQWQWPDLVLYELHLTAAIPGQHSSALASYILGQLTVETFFCAVSKLTVKVTYNLSVSTGCRHSNINDLKLSNLAQNESNKWILT